MAVSVRRRLLVYMLLFPLTGQILVSWRIGVLRRYGVNSVCFTFDTGKYVHTIHLFNR